MRRTGPRLALGADDVEMREQQQRLLAAGAGGQASDDVLPPGSEIGDLVWNLLGIEPRGDDLHGARFVARRVGGVGRDQAREE